LRGLAVDLIAALSGRTLPTGRLTGNPLTNLDATTAEVPA
jgi:hypothetical protein